MPIGRESVGTAYVTLLADGSRLDASIEKELRKSDGTVSDAGERHGGMYSDGFRDGFDGGFLDNLDRKLQEFGKTIRRNDRDTRNWGNTIGKLFGKGARNDFLNFVGSVVGGLARLTISIAKVSTALTKRLLGAFEGTFSGLSKTGYNTILGLGSALLGLAFAGTAAAVSIAAISLVIGPVAALLSGLTGIVLALASSLAFALVGAVGVLGAALVPLTAGIGVVVAGLIAMDDAQKKVLKNDLKPATNAFKALGDTAFKAITRDIGKNAKDLAPVIRRLNPLVKSLGNAVADVGTSWTKSISGDGFQHFVNVLDRALPGMLRRLGNITSNTLGGLGGIFEGAIPNLRRFLAWLDQITGRFSDWANSVAGQKAIRKFFDDAADSAKALGGFLRRVWNLTTLILDQGKDTGDNLFERMGKAVETFTKFLKDNPKALDDFFANAEETAKNLGKIAVNLGKIFDSLDNPRNRKNMQTTLGFFESLSSGQPEEDAGIFGWIGAGLNKILHWGGWAPLNKLFDHLKEPFTDKDFNLFPGNQTINLTKLKDQLGKINWGAIIPDISWSDLIPDVKWSDFIPKFGDAWSKFVNSLKWSHFIPDVRWSSFVPDISWSSFIPDVKWSNFIPDVKWGSLIPDIKWSDIIPDIDWDDFVPTLNVHINWPDPPKWLAKITPGMAAGGVVSGPQRRLIGEAGPEAVVPLNRPLNLVDPSVRALSAFAQGLSAPAGGGLAGVPSSQVNNNLYITTASKDPRAVATETLNYLTALAY